MSVVALIDTYIAEAIGVVVVIGLFAFAVDYTRSANWRENDQGRAVMYLILSFVATVTLLVIHGFVPHYPGQWIVEFVVFTPLAVSAFYLRHTLRKSFGLPTRWLVRVPKKKVSHEEALEEDTLP